MLRKSQAGFTLVELMIVLVILIVLAGIGYPLYQDQVRKARRTDARDAAMRVALAQEQLFTREGRYTNNLNETALNLRGPLKTGKSEGSYYDIAVAVGDSSFTITVSPAAGGSQTKDLVCTQFTVDQTGRKDATGSDPTKCW